MTKVRFPCRLAKQICERIYGKPLYPGTWANWRKWANCPRRRSLSREEMLKLAAIAYLRLKYPHSELDELRILATMQSVNPLLAKTLIEIEKANCITGGQAIQLLGVSRATAYRKVPEFSARKVYHLDEIRSYFNSNLAAA